MEEIAKWLENQDYQEGIALYKKYGADPVLLTIFALPETSFTKSKLEKALNDLVPKEHSSTPLGETVRLSEVEVKAITPKPVLDLIRKRSQLHETLFYQTSKSDRLKIAKAILAIGTKLDRWYDHGELPAGEAENELPEMDIPVNAWELHQQINNNLAYITKNRKRENKAGEVKRRERQNLGIEERLKLMNYEVTG
ncbi:hypothetical protein [Algoriphagus resistens]|uniref:hypothetical protein n=1 Tax=Algoriphagus resistens TaxID=1750590 RepID=UPI000716AA5B|nr:hypothetical protein [Algoriphagus resistens]